MNIVCAVPFCQEGVTEYHHLWRRSELIGAWDWVEIPDFGQVGNKVGLCRKHHEAVTVNAAWITFEPGIPAFTWGSLLDHPQALVWQPPMRPDNVNVIDVPPIEAEDLPSLPPVIHVHEHIEDGICVTCKQPLPKPRIKTPKEERRPRRSWTVTVPVDERENGAETLDTLLEAAREEMARAGLPYSGRDEVKFFVLSAALALFVQHATEVLG